MLQIIFVRSKFSAVEEPENLWIKAKRPSNAYSIRVQGPKE